MGVRQIHLFGEGFSGRGVRLRDIGPAEADEAGIEAGVEAGENIFKFGAEKVRRSLYRIITEVTPRDVGKKEAADARKAAIAAKTTELQPKLDAFDKGEDGGDDHSELARARLVQQIGAMARIAGEEAADEARANALLTAKWIPVTFMDLANVKPGPNAYDKLFEQKDHEVLAAYYRKFFSATNVEAERILGKALAVSEG